MGVFDQSRRATINGNKPDPLGARPTGAPSGDYMCPITASANPLHFTSFAPSMRRAKS
jgi:hypothetical protein